MGLPQGNVGIIIAALSAGLIATLITLIILIIYMKRKNPSNFDRRRISSIFPKERKTSRAHSCFNLLAPSLQENGKAPEFSIPLINRNVSTTRPKRTCQLQFSLNYNFHTSKLSVQVICVQNLPRLFGLQSGVFVKVSLVDGEGELREELGKTATQFRKKNPVFRDVFENAKEIPFVELNELSVSLSLFSFDRFSQSHFVGNVTTKFADINLDPLEPAIFWRPVQRKSDASSPNVIQHKGQLVLSLRYQEKTGRINVVVMKGINLVTPKRLLRTDPYVVVKLLHNGKVVEKKRTQCCKRNLNPVWNEPFVFDLKNGSNEVKGYTFLFEIKSSDVVGPDASLGRVEICQETSDHWKEMMERKNYARAMCHNVS